MRKWKNRRVSALTPICKRYAFPHGGSLFKPRTVIRVHCINFRDEPIFHFRQSVQYPGTIFQNLESWKGRFDLLLTTNHKTL